MTKDNQKTNRGQPPKINLNGTENGAPAKTPPPARPFIPFNMNADLDATKKQTARIDLSSVTSIPNPDAAIGRLRVARVERKQRKRNPAPPFITSTLQQEASRKLGFSTQRTMRVA